MRNILLLMILVLLLTACSYDKKEMKSDEIVDLETKINQL